MEACLWWLPLEYKDNLAWKVGITKKIRLLYVLTLNIWEVCSGVLATFKSIFFITEWKETCCNHKKWIIIKWYVLGISLLVRKLKKIADEWNEKVKNMSSFLSNILRALLFAKFLPFLYLLIANFYDWFSAYLPVYFNS